MASNSQSFQYAAPTWPYASMVSPSPLATAAAPLSSSSPLPPFSAQSPCTTESLSFNSLSSSASSSTFSSPVHSYSSSPSGSSYCGSLFTPLHQDPPQPGHLHTPTPGTTGFGSPAGNDIRFMPSMAAHFVPPRTTPEEDLAVMLTGVSLRSDVESSRQTPERRDLPSAFMGMQLAGPTPDSLADPMASLGLGSGNTQVENAAEMLAGLSFGNGVGGLCGHPQQMQWLPGINPNAETDPNYAPMDMDVTDPRNARGHTHHHQSYIN